MMLLIVSVMLLVDNYSDGDVDVDVDVDVDEVDCGGGRQQQLLEVTLHPLCVMGLAH